MTMRRTNNKGRRIPSSHSSIRLGPLKDGGSSPILYPHLEGGSPLQVGGSATIADPSTTTSTFAGVGMSEQQQFSNTCGSGAFETSFSPTSMKTPLFPTPNFMLPRTGSFKNEHPPTGTPSFLPPTTGAAANPSANTGQAVPSAQYRMIVEEYEERLSRIQLRYPTVSLTSEVSCTAVRSIATTPTVPFMKLPFPTSSESMENHMFPFNDLSVDQLKGGSASSLPVSQNNSFAKLPSFAFPSTPVPGTGIPDQSSLPPTETSVRKSLESLSEASKLDLLVDLISAIGEFARTQKQVKKVAGSRRNSMPFGNHVPSDSLSTNQPPSHHPTPPVTALSILNAAPILNGGDSEQASPLFTNTPKDAFGYFQSKAITPKVLPSPSPSVLNSNEDICTYYGGGGVGPNDGSGSPSTNSALTRNSSVASIMDPVPVFESKTLTQTYDPEGNEMVNNYSLIGELGSGSFAKVHLAEHNTTQELVAVKIIKKCLRRKFARNAGGAQQVATEIALLKKVKHRNIIKLHGVIDDPDDDKVVMIMQYASGGALLLPAKKRREGSTANYACVGGIQNQQSNSNHMDEDDVGVTGVGYEPIAPETAANYTRQVATGLDYLHRHDILHRDIKPENLLLDGVSGDRVLISDLGVGAMFSDASALRKTAGTPAFFSPEICRGEVHLHGKASDIWALGITTYCMVFGQVPFKETTGGMSGLFNAIQNDALQVPEGTPRDLRDFLSRILNKDPLRRLTLAEIKTHPWIVKNNRTNVTFTSDSSFGGTANDLGKTIPPQEVVPRSSNPDSGSAHPQDVALTLTVEEIQKAVFRVPSMKMATKERKQYLANGDE